MNKKLVIGLATAGLVLGGVGGSVAWAAIPSTSGSVYHACVNNTGPVRTMYMMDKDAGEHCLGGYTEKTWNQTGPAGATGLTGPAGAAGAKGDKGDKGDPGSSAAFATVQVTATDASPTTLTETGGDGSLNYSYEYDAVATCPTGYVATGGGLSDASLTARLPGLKTGPTTDGKGWRAYIVQGSSSDSLGVTVVCTVGTTS